MRPSGVIWQGCYNKEKEQTMAYSVPQSTTNTAGKPQPKPATIPNQPRIISKQVFTDFASI